MNRKCSSLAIVLSLLSHGLGIPMLFIAMARMFTEQVFGLRLVDSA